MIDTTPIELTSTFLPMLLFPLNFFVVTLPYVFVQLFQVALLIGWLPARKVQLGGGGHILWWIYGASLIIYLASLLIIRSSTVTVANGYMIEGDFVYAFTAHLRDFLFSSDVSIWSSTWAVPFGGRGMDFGMASELTVLRITDFIAIGYFAIAAFFQYRLKMRA